MKLKWEQDFPGLNKHYCINVFCSVSITLLRNQVIVDIQAPQYFVLHMSQVQVSVLQPHLQVSLWSSSALPSSNHYSMLQTDQQLMLTLHFKFNNHK